MQEKNKISDNCVSQGKLFDDDHWLYKNSADNKYRYVLGEKGDNPLVCIGVNPSTAEPEKLDPTLRNVKAWSKRLGYDGWIMVNLYPQRATNPNDLHDKKDLAIKCANQDAIEKHFDSRKSPMTVWAAWGTLIEKRAYLKECLKYFAEYLGADNWIAIGPPSVKGHPHHPLYLSRESKPEPFDVNQYLESLG